MNHSRRRPSPFALAAPPESVAAEIDVDDVLAVRRDWTRQQAGRFLSQHAGDLGAAMVQAGVVALIALAGSKADTH